MGQRAVSPVMGMVVLVGLTAIVGLSVVVVGITVVDGAQSSAETTQAENSMVEFASTADDIATSRSQSSSFSFVGDDEGSTWVNESAGYMELVVRNGSDETTIPVGDLGVYRHETSDGTEIAYQAGSVWRVDDGEPALITPPNLDFRESGNTSTLQFPIVNVTGDGVGGGSVDGDAMVVDRRTLLESTNLSNPIHGDELEVRISSRYCEGWEAYVLENTPATTTESCGDGTSDRLAFMHSLPDAPDEAISNASTGTDRWTEEAVRTASDFGLHTGANGAIDGNVSHGGTFGVPGYYPVSNNETIAPTEVTHDAEISTKIHNGNSWQDLCGANCTYTAGTYYIDNDNLDSGMNDDVELDVSAGNVTLVLNTSLTLQTGQDLVVRGHDGTNNVARIYTEGDLTFKNQAEIGSADPASYGSPSANYDGDADVLRIIGSSDTDLVLHDSVRFEGIYDAPAGSSGTSELRDDCRGSEFYIAGVIRTGTFDVCSGDYYHSYDDSLANSTVRGDWPTNDTNSTDGRFYLHATETQIEVDS